MDKAEYFNRVEFVRENVSRNDKLLQLAEECNELAQAILKVRRLEKSSNKPHQSKSEIYANLYEEMADVELCMDILKNELTSAIILVEKNHKLKRWCDRIDTEGAYEECKN